MNYDHGYFSSPTEVDPDKLFVGKVPETLDGTNPYVALQKDVQSKIEFLKDSLLSEYRKSAGITETQQDQLNITQNNNKSDESIYSTYLVNLSSAITNLLDLKSNLVYIGDQTEKFCMNNEYLKSRLKEMLNLCQIQFKYNRLRSELVEACNYFDLSRAQNLKSEMVKLDILSIQLHKKDDLIKKLDSPHVIFKEGIEKLLKKPNPILLFNLLAYTINKSAIPDNIEKIICNGKDKIEWTSENMKSVGEILTIFESMTTIFKDAVDPFKKLKDSHFAAVKNLNKFTLDNLLIMEKSKYIRINEFQLFLSLFNHNFYTHDGKEIFKNLKELKRMQMFAIVGISFMIQQNSGDEFKDEREELVRILGNYKNNEDQKKKYVEELSQLFPEGAINHELALVSTSYLVEISLNFLQDAEFRVNEEDFNAAGLNYF